MLISMLNVALLLTFALTVIALQSFLILWCLLNCLKHAIKHLEPLKQRLLHQQWALSTVFSYLTFVTFHIAFAHSCTSPLPSIAINEKHYLHTMLLNWLTGRMNEQFWLGNCLLDWLPLAVCVCVSVRVSGGSSDDAHCDEGMLGLETERWELEEGGEAKSTC